MVANHGQTAIRICHDEGQNWKRARERAGWSKREAAIALGGTHLMGRVYEIEEGFVHAEVAEAKLLEAFYSRRKIVPKWEPSN